jgi:hypothetical protein
MLIQWPDKFYHTSQDTLDKVDPGMLARAAILTATYAYFLANAGDKEVAWLAGELAAGFAAQCSVAGRAVVGGEDARPLRQRLEFLRDCRLADIASLDRLLDGTAAHLADDAREAARSRVAAELEASYSHYSSLGGGAAAAAVNPMSVTSGAGKVVRRSIRGPIGRREMFAGLTPALRKEWTDQANALLAGTGKDARAVLGMASTALFWMDGKRTLAEVAHLVTMESGWCDLAALQHLCSALAAQGLIAYSE